MSENNKQVAAVLACTDCGRLESSGYTMVHLCPFHAMGLTSHVLAVAHERRASMNEVVPTTSRSAKETKP